MDRAVATAEDRRPVRRADRLDRRLPWLLLAPAAVLYAVVAARLVLPVDGLLIGPLQQPIGGDFRHFWTSAVLLSEGRIAAAFDPEVFRATEQRLLGREFPDAIWALPYPPHFVLYVAPLAALPYLPAYALWLVLTFAVYLAAGLGGRWHLPAAVGLALAPAAFLNALAGQNGFLSAGLLVGGLALLDRRPVVAGVLFGLLAYKPQLGLLLPVALAARRSWAAFAAAAATAIAVVAASAGILGPELWHRYLTEVVPAQGRILEQGGGVFTYMMPTVFMAGRMLGLASGLSYAAQAAALVAAAAGTWLVFRRDGPAWVRSAALATGAFLATPYAYVYDLPVIAAALTGPLLCLGPAGLGAAGWTLLALCGWVRPLLLVPLNALGLPVGPPLLAAAFLLLVRRALSEPARD